MKRKILIIVENETVPFDTRVRKEALSLYQNGYDVTVLCPRGMQYRKRHEVIDGVHIYRHPMPKPGNSAFGHLLEYACALFWEFFYAWWIYFRRGFHLIQGCNPPDDIVLIALPFKLLGVKYIFDHHDANPELYLSIYGNKGALYKAQCWLEKLTYRFADVVMATNESYKQLAINRGGVDPHRVFIVRNGPDLETFNPVPANPALKHGKDFLVGYVGTMSVQDGLDILLDVALHVKNMGRRDIHFTCVGGGPGLRELQKLVEQKDLLDMVNFTGRIPDEQLLEILSTADICVNPDKPCEMNDISTMIKIMEYMALGKPIVQLDLKEGRFSAQEASLYADKENPIADFAAKILWLLDNPEARKTMGEYGRHRVENKLAWKYSVENLLAAYQCAFKKGRSLQPQHHISSSTSLFYFFKPLIPRSLQIALRRRRSRRILPSNTSVWPIDPAASTKPADWPGWPGDKKFALVLTHDVESPRGVSRVRQLMDIEMNIGFRSAFNFVGDDYEIPLDLIQILKEKKFEIGVHGLHHNGRMYSSRRTFNRHRIGIQNCLKIWDAVGFRSPSMHRRVEWLHELGLRYDSSTFDTDPFEPQPHGVGTIFPFWIVDQTATRAYVELPYTLPQDFTLFNILQEKTNDIWKRKLDWIASNGGMALLIVHPDYLSINGQPANSEEYPLQFYSNFLEYVRNKHAGQYWAALPSQVADYFASIYPKQKQLEKKTAGQTGC